MITILVFVGVYIALVVVGRKLRQLMSVKRLAALVVAAGAAFGIIYGFFAGGALTIPASIPVSMFRWEGPLWTEPKKTDALKILGLSAIKIGVPAIAMASGLLSKEDWDERAATALWGLLLVFGIASSYALIARFLVLQHFPAYQQVVCAVCLMLPILWLNGFAWESSQNR